MNEVISIFVGMALINNFILVRFLGLCPFFGVSRKLSTAVSMGAAVTFVMVIASAAIWLITNYILIPFNVEYMNIVVYVLVIVSLVPIVELFIMRTNYTVYKSFGIYLPLITINCAVLGIILINAKEAFSFLESVVAAMGAGIGFTFVLAIMSAIRERLDLADCPKAIKGLPVAFITAALLGLAFSGFAGL